MRWVPLDSKPSILGSEFMPYDLWPLSWNKLDVVIKGPKFRGKMDFAAMDSLLQVTPEQKATLEASRAKGDSIFKELRKQKHEAEKALGEALESKDSAGIDAAKAKVLDADKALLEHRINGMQALAGILTAEQLEKFNAFHKERTKAFKERFKNGPHHGPHGNPPAAN